MQIIDGFTFENEELATLAKKEEEGILYITEHTSLNNPNVVYNLYTKLVEQKLFTTPAGIRFLIKLQNLLYEADEIPDEDIPPIPAEDFMKAVTVAEASETAAEAVEKTERKTKPEEAKSDSFYKKAYHVSLFFAIIFAISVVGMFIITKLSSNNINILNYREEIINEYAEWEESLKEKEASLKEREMLIEKKEAELENQ